MTGLVYADACVLLCVCLCVCVCVCARACYIRERGRERARAKEREREGVCLGSSADEHCVAIELRELKVCLLSKTPPFGRRPARPFEIAALHVVAGRMPWLASGRRGSDMRVHIRIARCSSGRGINNVNCRGVGSSHGRKGQEFVRSAGEQADGLRARPAAPCLVEGVCRYEDPLESGRLRGRVVRTSQYQHMCACARPRVATAPRTARAGELARASHTARTCTPSASIFLSRFGACDPAAPATGQALSPRASSSPSPWIPPATGFQYRRFLALRECPFPTA